MPPKIRVSVYCNSDDAFICWKPTEVIPNCVGFQLESKRVINGQETIQLVENRVGFARDNPQPDEHRPSNVWPFQRVDWTDHAVNAGDHVSYRVTAMIAGANNLLQPGPASDWSESCALTADVGDGFSCFFNRGLVMSQFMARIMKGRHLTVGQLKGVLRDKEDLLRKFLMGDLGEQLLQILDDARTGHTDLFAAMYELNDPEILDALMALKDQMHLVLSSGAAYPDENSVARGDLSGSGAELYSRMTKKGVSAHNKFLVITDLNKDPSALWTGSTNWQTTGLCTQINNAILIQDAPLAKSYVEQWGRLRDASPDETAGSAQWPGSLIKSNDQPKTFNIGQSQVTLWFTRTSKHQDLDALKQLIADAKQSILFLMFMPGPNGLDVDCAKRVNDGLYVQGVVSSISNDNDVDYLDVNLYADSASKVDRYEVVQPQGVETSISSWAEEVTRRQFQAIGHAIVHSKVMVIDPLGAKPVVVTGSHNFSNNASKQNDENLLIIRGHSKLAQAYAVNIMAVYQHYRWRSYLRDCQKAHKTPWSHLSTSNTWLRDYMKGHQTDMDFWCP